jgi:hypothetical protein
MNFESELNYNNDCEDDQQLPIFNLCDQSALNIDIIDKAERQESMHLDELLVFT